MTQHLDDPEQADNPGTTSRRAPAPARPGRAGGRARGTRSRLSLLLLSATGIAFVVYVIRPYLTLDPAQARIPPQHWLHYAFLAGHVITGSVAVLTTLLQLWPWLRREHPAVHRASGRVYLLAGAIPSALLALAMYPVAFTPGSVAVLLAAPLWTISAVLGWVRARQHRYAEHRRWMVYSFAIMWGFGVWGFVIGNVGMHWLGINPFIAVEAARWVGWVGTLLIAHWWLERRAGRNLGGVSTRAKRNTTTAVHPHGGSTPTVQLTVPEL
ncbi:uncharacterized membrane protein YozB (DUF420 family) [Actinokineospora baliensis]|uniref:DUF2306 domain-containing protein n=1 Tax=Actinokineospora baliensis TaxID=547056 RepID=UPI00195ABC02|nr:DUF2306 domain-containing protein [Actinokineospora baliensis]MBM7774566.1 uncharacterized membrane protein YozB (DUF420 family) [Actinokineospora baliensis]